MYTDTYIHIRDIHTYMDAVYVDVYVYVYV